MPSDKIRDLKASALLKECGTRAKYSAGCRCSDCRRANTEYENERARARKSGGWNGLVDADPVRLHLIALSRKGIGSKTVHEYSDVARSVIVDIINGKKSRVRKSTADRLLAVDKDCYKAGTLIGKAEFSGQMRYLLNEGFTKTEIARRLGLKSRAIQFGKRKKITGRTAARLSRFVGKLKLGEEE
jgi:hypothetical protein